MPVSFIGACEDFAKYVRVLIAQISSFFARVARALSPSESIAASVSDFVEKIKLSIVPKGQGFSFTRSAPLMLFMLLVATQGFAQSAGAAAEVAGTGTTLKEVMEHLFKGIDLGSLEVLFANFDIVYGVLILAGGYLSYLFPWLNQINSGTYRVLAWAILTGVGFLMFGSSVITLSITYAVSTSLYQVIFKWFKKSPKTAAQVEAEASLANAAADMLKNISRN